MRADACVENRGRSVDNWSQLTNVVITFPGCSTCNSIYDNDLYSMICLTPASRIVDPIIRQTSSFGDAI